MYRESGQWEEALRVARAHASTEESCALALDWAIFVGPEVGGKLLLRNGIIDQCVDMACQKELVIISAHHFVSYQINFDLKDPNFDLKNPNFEK